MDPLLEVQRKSRSMDRDAYRESLDRPVKAVTESTPYRLADLILNGEDVDLPMAESLIPTVPLQAKLKQGKLPGLADIMDIPNPLSAMAPIGYGLKELKAGARLGKSLRNIGKAREARDYVHRVHRTLDTNEKGISGKGLLAGKANPNYGKNTGDTEDYPGIVWLGTDPMNIPVLQWYFLNRPDRLRTYNVRIPREVYNQTPRVTFEGGRGSGRPRVVGKGENSLFGETARRTGKGTVIDTFGNNIPPDYLTLIDKRHFKGMLNKHKRREHLKDLYEKFYGDMSDKPTVHDLARFKLDVLDQKPSLEYRTKPDLIGGTGNFENELYNVQNVYLNNGAKYMPPPTMQLRDLLNSEGVYITRPSPSKNDSWEKLIENAESAADYTQPLGAISRGHVYDEQYGNTRFPKVKERNYNWSAYKANIANGESPASAHSKSLPQYHVDWGMFPEDTPRAFEKDYGDYANNLLGLDADKVIHLGAISRPMSERNYESPAKKLYRLASKFNPDDSRFGPRLNAITKLSDIIDKSENPSPIIEKIATSNNKLGSLKDVLGDIEFSASRGSIARGMDNDAKPVTQYLRDIDNYIDDNDWQVNPDDPKEVEELIRRAKENAIHEHLESIKDDFVKANILRLKDLLDNPPK